MLAFDAPSRFLRLDAHYMMSSSKELEKNSFIISLASLMNVELAARRNSRWKELRMLGKDSASSYRTVSRMVLGWRTSALFMIIN